MKVRKQKKILFYPKGYSRLLLPAKKNFTGKITELKAKLSEEQLLKVQERVDYYCKTSINGDSLGNFTIKDLKRPKTPKAYYFDTYEYARYFPENLPINVVFGDVTEVPELPSIVKSRPISENNQKSILLNLDKARHFVFVEDSKDFLSKKNRLIGRGTVYQDHRHQFFEKYFNHPLTDIGQVNKIGGDLSWYKPKLPIEKHLDYKFILSLQGNDVATNLKWIMSSNSVAVMPKPTIESWFMEGKLVGGEHFIEIKSDYSDFEAQMNFYINHPEKCLEIIKNANEHSRQFLNKNMENLCSLMVLEKYYSEIK